MYVLYALISVVVVSLMSVIAAIPLLMRKKVPEGLLLFLLSASVGVLLGTVFLDFMPELAEEGYTMTTALLLLFGFLLMFIMEKFIHWHHSKKCETKHGHSHGYSIAPINLIGDGIHNFIDGLVIAGSFAVNTAVGISATISIIFHELPQEIADFGVLLYSGFSKKKALFFNFLSAVMAIVGTILGILLISKLQGFENLIIPFAAGNFIYIAASNLLPELHRKCGIKDTALHIFAFILGVGIVILVSFIGPAH
ncbi:MAG: ZIP family metal transporter [Candidatus Woesearchaeota archaeon]|jgi:zinc and cadmium transporter